MCPYHAWTYALDGRLIATPHLDDDDVDKSDAAAVAVPPARVAGLRLRQPQPRPAGVRRAGCSTHCAGAARAGALPVRRPEGGAPPSPATSHANWKIVVENYQECLHCTRVHPELVDLVPIYRTGLGVRPRAAPTAGSRSPAATACPSPRWTCPTLPGSVRLRRRVVLRRHDLPQRVHRRHRPVRHRLHAVPEGPEPDHDDDGVPVRPGDRSPRRASTRHRSSSSTSSSRSRTTSCASASTRASARRRSTTACSLPRTTWSSRSSQHYRATMAGG